MILHYFKSILEPKRLKSQQVYDAEGLSKLDKCITNLSPILASLYNLPINNSTTTIKIGRKLFYSIPKIQDLPKASAAFLCPFLFGSITLDSFYEILCNIFIERSMIFVSADLNRLTSSM